VLELRDEAWLLAKSRPPPRHHGAAIDHGKCESEEGAYQLREQWSDIFSEHQTTIVVYDNEDWTKDFRQFVRLSWRMQQEALGGLGSAGLDLTQQLQLVVFHPQATHQT
jgi:hypothetical protein